MVTEPTEILLVDMGNQRLKWRLIPAGVAGRAGAPGEGHDGAIPIGRNDGAGLASFVNGLSSGFDGVGAPSRVLLSAVSQGEAVSAFREWAGRTWDVAVESIESGAEFGGLINDYDDPAQLGCDRWLAALAAHRRTLASGAAEPVVVVDAGTAVTVDLVLDNHFVGGSIMPGFSTMVRVLGRDTGRIRLTGSDMGAFQRIDAATNSDDAVRSGSWHAVCGGVDRCIRVLTGLAERTPTVLWTGGDAALVRDGLAHGGEICSNLVLDGLAFVAGETGR